MPVVRFQSRTEQNQHQHCVRTEDGVCELPSVVLDYSNTTVTSVTDLREGLPDGAGLMAAVCTLQMLQTPQHFLSHLDVFAPTILYIAVITSSTGNKIKVRFLRAESYPRLLFLLPSCAALPLTLLLPLKYHNLPLELHELLACSLQDPSKADANVERITAKVKDALGCDEPITLTDSQGNEIVDSEGTRTTYSPDSSSCLTPCCHPPSLPSLPVPSGLNTGIPRTIPQPSLVPWLPSPGDMEEQKRGEGGIEAGASVWDTGLLVSRVARQGGAVSED
ncbi:hypothetical protein FQN60_005206 [Etheostoma spectabile]|uniref:Uncharacterized protein n=1 Tax=Etheostoma spectabile TaxID=54343 RepID=A0A5J5DM46_9PERO|nr:hypothetical protein FQN60_005206 [Etheostoma spectabile]